MRDMVDVSMRMGSVVMSSLTRTTPFGLTTPKAGGEALASRAGTSDTAVGL
jgi:hypothetical protein